MSSLPGTWPLVQQLTVQFTFTTCPITTSRFRSRVRALAEKHLATLNEANVSADTTKTPDIPDPVVTSITPEDTGLFPAGSTKTTTAYSCPWIDLASPSPLVSSVSRQVLNLEITYATFCGVRTIVIPGPRRDATTNDGADGLMRYSRAIKEALKISPRLSFVIHMPMYREPNLEDTATLTEELSLSKPCGDEAIDLFSVWDSWDHIRSVCGYSSRLFVGMFASLPAVLEAHPLCRTDPTQASVFQGGCPKLNCRLGGSPSLCTSFRSTKAPFSATRTTIPALGRTTRS
jgi:type II protein arginine methyltransferase